MAKRQTKQDKLVNHLIADLICAEMDYNDGKLSVDILEFFVKKVCLLAVSNLDAKHHRQFLDFSTVVRLRERFYNGA